MSQPALCPIPMTASTMKSINLLEVHRSQVPWVHEQGLLPGCLGRWKHEELSSGPHAHNDGQRAFAAVLFAVLQFPESTGCMATVFGGG